MAAFGAGDQVTAAAPTGSVARWGTWNLPNFVGELFKLSPLETPFLSSIGGLTGGQGLSAPQWTWQDTLHRAPALQSVPEGDDPTYSMQKRNERTNVVAIHQYGVETSYTKMAATGLLGSSGSTPTTGAESIVGGTQPVQDELGWQMQVKLEQAALDVELMFLTGSYGYPADGTARQTQGLIGAISADTSTDNQTPAVPASRTIINEIVQKMYDEGAPQEVQRVFMMPSAQVLELENSYAQSSDGWNLAPLSRTQFGVNITDITTAFGTFGIMVNRQIPANQILVVDLAQCAPKFLAIPGKGHFFVEPLSKDGAYERYQLYGEVGLHYGVSKWHGRTYNLNTA